MSHTIVGKLNKAATQFQAGESVGFGVRVGVKYYDRDTKQNEFTNYEAVIFAKAPAQIQFYQSALVEGAIIEVSGDQQKIKTFDGQNGQSISIELLNAKLGYIHSPNQQAPQQQAQQGGFQQQAPQQQGGFQQQQQGFAPQQQQGGYAPQQGFAPQGNQNPQF